MAGIKQKPSGIESHNAIGVGERYHSFLRQIYTKVRSEHPDISAEYALTLATKAMNDSAGPNGLVPTLLVFGGYATHSHCTYAAPGANSEDEGNEICTVRDDKGDGK